jgi:hypothetical protein
MFPIMLVIVIVSAIAVGVDASGIGARRGVTSDYTSR